MRLSEKFRRYIDDVVENDEMSLEEAAFMMGYYSEEWIFIFYY